jgi:hypothetical protein
MEKQGVKGESGWMFSFVYLVESKIQSTLEHTKARRKTNENVYLVQTIEAFRYIPSWEKALPNEASHLKADFVSTSLTPVFRLPSPKAFLLQFVPVKMM